VAEENDGIFREIEEELRHEKASKLWRAYGNYVIGGALVLVLGVAGMQAWRSYDLKQRTARGLTFDQARTLGVEGKTAQAIAAFEKIAKEKSDGYGRLARFREAGLMAKNGDAAGAAAAYQTLSHQDGLAPQYRDLAVVLGALQELNTSATSTPLIDRLPDLLDANNPWHHSAREALAIADLKRGDRAGAIKNFKALVDDATTPQGVAQRATEMLNTIDQP